MKELNNFANRKTNLYFSTILYLMAGLTLMVLPMPNAIKWVWPNWVLLVVIYRVLGRPQKYGIFFGFTVGFIVDLILANKLGLHAVSYALICYCILKIQHRIYLFPAVQQAMLIFFLVLLDFVAIMTFTIVKLNWIFIGHSLLAATSTAAIWLIVVSVFGLRQELAKI